MLLDVSILVQRKYSVHCAHDMHSTRRSMLDCHVLIFCCGNALLVHASMYAFRSLQKPHSIPHSQCAFAVLPGFSPTGLILAIISSFVIK